MLCLARSNIADTNDTRDGERIDQISGIENLRIIQCRCTNKGRRYFTLFYHWLERSVICFSPIYESSWFLDWIKD